jgi:hypothetical protein
MAQPERVCACGRDSIDVVRVASEDGVLLIPVCAECIEDPTAADQRELFERPEPRRPLTRMSARDEDPQSSLELDDDTDTDERRDIA